MAVKEIAEVEALYKFYLKESTILDEQLSEARSARDRMNIVILREKISANQDIRHRLWTIFGEKFYWKKGM